jgi:hypothetical protein
MATDWNETGTPSTLTGNWNRMVKADGLADGAGGVDFNNTFNVADFWVFTDYASVKFVKNREDST